MVDRRELFSALHRAVLDGDDAAAGRLAAQAVASGVPALEAIEQGLVPGIREAGRRWEDGDYFLPELVTAAQAMKAAMAILQPRLGAEGRALTLGRVVIGTVEGDIHDIGKTLVATMLAANGFEVSDEGASVPVARLVERARELDADLVCASALLTTTMPKQRELAAALQGVRFAGAPDGGRRPGQQGLGRCDRRRRLRRQRAGRRDRGARAGGARCAPLISGPSRSIASCCSTAASAACSSLRASRPVAPRSGGTSSTPSASRPSTVRTSRPAATSCTPTRSAPTRCAWRRRGSRGAAARSTPRRSRSRARACAGRALVAGDVGPTGHLLPPVGTASVEELGRAFAEQAEALAEAGADLISIETMTDLREALAAVAAARATGLAVHRLDDVRDPQTRVLHDHGRPARARPPGARPSRCGRGGLQPGREAPIAGARS